MSSSLLSSSLLPKAKGYGEAIDSLPAQIQGLGITPDEGKGRVVGEKVWEEIIDLPEELKYTESTDVYPPNGKNPISENYQLVHGRYNGRDAPVLPEIKVKG